MPTVQITFCDMVFEWDTDKQKLVMEKHHISFEECCSVFLDFNYVTIPDMRFDNDEQRYLTIGMSNQARLLVIAWTSRSDNIRLISAMKAERHYERRYNAGY